MKSEWDSANAKLYKHTDDCSMKSDWYSAENLIDGADGEQSLRLDGRKVCNIKGAGISQAESNKATVCALPSIHLPFTREASVVVRGEGIVRFWEGWFGRKGGGAFERAVGGGTVK